MHKLSKGKFFLMFATVLMLAACIQESENDRIPVRYTVLVRDGKTGKALEGASVELTGEDLVARTLTTNENGRTVFPSIESYVNQVIVSAEGYIPGDSVDVVTDPDTTLDVILRTLNLALLPQGYDASDTGTVFTYTVTVLNSETSSPIKGATVSVQSGGAKSVKSTTDSNGRVILDSLPSRQNLFSISATGYIVFDTLDVAPDTTDDDLELRSLRVLLDPAVAE